MDKITTRILFLLLIVSGSAFAQQGRIQGIQKKLDSLSETVPGLKQSVQLQVNGSIQQYLSGIASVNSLNISVDPKLNFAINDNLSGVSATNILVFLAKKYNLDISVVGSIIYVTAYDDPARYIKPPVKEINAKYNKNDNTLSLALENDTLKSVAKKISQVSGKNVIVPNNLESKLVSGYIEAAPFETALDKLAFTNNIKMVKTNDGFFLFQMLDENEELYVTGDKGTATRKAFRPVNNAGANMQSGVYSRTVNGKKLLTADAVNSPIINMVKQASQELGISYSVYSDIKGTIDIHVKDITYDAFLNLLFRGTTYTFQSENGVYMIGDSKLSGLRTFKAIHLQNRSIDTVVNMIPAEWKRTIEIKEFRDQNTIIISGASADIREAEAFIKSLDELVPVVLIEVTMIDFHKTNTIATGISAGVADSTVKTGGTLLPGVNFTASASSVNSFLNSLGKLTSLNLGHVVPNFYATIQALESNNNIDVRSVPKLTALNGHSAKLSIGSQVYYKNTTQNLYPSTTTNTSVFTNVYTPVKADLSVDIKPIVSGNDQVTLNINVNISDFTSIPSDGSPPPQSISQFTSSLRVHSDDTILLGGIERTENDLTSSGVPLLSRIPILKWIFSSRTKTASKVVTVLFIKATIIR